MTPEKAAAENVLEAFEKMKDQIEITWQELLDTGVEVRAELPLKFDGGASTLVWGTYAPEGWALYIERFDERNGQTDFTLLSRAPLAARLEAMQRMPELRAAIYAAQEAL